MNNVEKSKIVNSFLKFGMDKSQAEIYFTCLSYDRLTIQDLSVKSGIKRTTIYSNLENLEKSGIILITKLAGKTYIEAREPEILLKELEEKRDALKDNLGIIKNLKKENPFQSKIIYYKGKDGFKKFWRDLLESGVQDWLIMTSGKEFMSFVSQGYIKKVIREKRKKGIKSRQIITDSAYAREIIKDDRTENRESRIVSSNYPLPAIEIIFGNKLAIISSIYEDIILIIESKEISRTHRSYFELIWDLSEKLNR
jgi:sugar-specific transcriptional regulator TrmB